mmetsp:Transcript_23349/g.40741  ORF Transcript_23349/g.40741 Transcript_23349/m.40741 type:complete len:212 (-) Transcript_23349:398-1033(-)
MATMPKVQPRSRRVTATVAAYRAQRAGPVASRSSHFRSSGSGARSTRRRRPRKSARGSQQQSGAPRPTSGSPPASNSGTARLSPQRSQWRMAQRGPLRYHSSTAPAARSSRKVTKAHTGRRATPPPRAEDRAATAFLSSSSWSSPSSPSVVAAAVVAAPSPGASSLPSSPAAAAATPSGGPPPPSVAAGGDSCWVALPPPKTKPFRSPLGV